MHEKRTGDGNSASPLLTEIDRMRSGLARRFREVSSPSERFAISREMARLLERRRTLVQGPTSDHAQAS